MKWQMFDEIEEDTYSNGWVRNEIEVIVEPGKATVMCGQPHLSYGNWHHIWEKQSVKMKSNQLRIQIK